MKRFAIEWLWFIGCEIAVVAFSVAQSSSGASHVADAVVLGAFWGVAVYLATAIVRLTVWAIQRVTAAR